MASVATGSIGIWTVIVPTAIGMIAGLCGVALSIMLARKAFKHIKREDERWAQEQQQSSEMHTLESEKRKLEVKLLKKQIKTLD